jgi:fumarylacetoacetate (FAA) hydrolase
MRLATVHDGSRDGRLIVVDREGRSCVASASMPRTLQAALDDWERHEPALREVAEKLDRGDIASQPVEPDRLLAPLPRAYEWIDGSAYLHHVRLARRARGAELPPSLESDPLVYQGGSSVLLGARAPIELPDAGWGLDFEAEVCVVLGDVPRGLSADRAESSIRLLAIANDLTYRQLVPAEIAKGFGFFQSKPATAFAPFAVTPDELGSSFRQGRLHGSMCCDLNGRRMGRLDPGVGMGFSFFDLIAHVARTRAFCAGTLLGSGTVSNDAPGAGVACIAEARAIETIETGSAKSRFLLAGDRLRIEMLCQAGQSPFGAIEQEVIGV